MAKQAPPKKKVKLVQAARKLGIEKPERFRPDELEALLGSLPTGSPDDIVFSPSSGALSSAALPKGPPSDTELQEELEAMEEEERDLSQGDPFFHEPHPDLPAPLGVDAVWLLAVEPRVLFVTWDASPQTRGRAGGSEDTQPILRLVSPDAAGQIDVEIDLRARGWYLQPPGDRMRLQVLLGLGRGAKFKPVAQSPVTSVPPSLPLPAQATYKVAVPYDMDRRLIPREAGNAWRQGESVPGAPPLELAPTPSAAEVVKRIREQVHMAPEGAPGAYEGAEEAAWAEEEIASMVAHEEFDVVTDLPNSAEYVRRRLRLVAQPRPRLMKPRKAGPGPEGLPLNLPSSMPTSRGAPSSQDSRRRS
ncbi:MAG: DUF4912 domain-containing protein [Myxococcota bacterium]